MEKHNKKVYTLITGASSGLGKEFCIQCAARKMNIIMLALPGGNTISIAEDIMLEYGVDVKVFEFDMTDSILLLEKMQLILENFEVDFLINNAGIGGTMLMNQTSVESLDRILQVNIRGMVLITQKLLPHLMKHQHSFIMNISSMAAFTPIAYKTVYPASKAFISSFSLGLREELHGSPVSVSVVYPGPIMTNSDTSERIMAQGIIGKIGLLSISAIARIALEKTLSKKAIIIPGLLNRLNQRLLSLLPREVSLRIVSRVVKKEMAIK